MRLKELDSLRGLAALAVAGCHIFVVVPATGLAASILVLASMTPLNAALDGHRAVLFFFILSGFVLAIPFYRGPVSPVAFVVKRVVRIYPAFWIGIALPFVLLIPMTDLPALLASVGLVGMAPVTDLNPVTWSLVHEMRLSLLFPLMILPVLRFQSRWVLLASAPLVAAGFFMDAPIFGGETGPMATVYYAWFFVIGAVAAKHVDSIVAYARAMSARRAGLWLAVALVTYGALPDAGGILPLEEVAIGVAVLGLMVLGLSRPAVSKLLLRGALRSLGRMAYSFYLLHLVWFEFVARHLYGVVPSVVIAVMGLVGALALAWLVYRWVEMPSIRLGQTLYLRISARTLPRPLTYVPATVPASPS